MTKTLKKNLRRSITGSIGRYIAILLIILLGTAFFTGLKLTRPAMIQTAANYISENHLFDLRLLSTIGFDDADVDAVRQVDGVTDAQGSINTDFLWVTDDARELVVRAHMLTETINQPQLVEGRMPQAGNECLADIEHLTAAGLGQVITVSTQEDDDSVLAYDSYTVVGLVHSPLYMSTERGTSSLGSGSVTGFVLIPPEGFDSEYYTELYVKCADYELYSQDYDDFIDTLSDAVEQSATLSVQARYDDLVQDAQEEIADAEQTLSDKQSEAQAELDDAKAQLDDAAVELDDAQRQLDDALQQLNDGEAELQKAKQQLDDAKAQLDDAAAQLLPGYSSWEEALQTGQQALADGQATLDAAIAQGQQQLDSQKAQLEDAENSYADGVFQLEAGQSAYESYLSQWQQGYDQYNAGEAEYAQNAAAYQEALAAYEQALADLDAARDSLPADVIAQQEAALEQTRLVLEQTAAQLAEARSTLDATADQLAQQKQALDETDAQLAQSKAQLDQLRATLDSSWPLYEAGVQELEAQRQQQQKTLDEAAASLAQFSSGIASYRSGEADYESGAATLAENWADYDQGVADLEQGQQDYLDGLADYQQGLEDFDREIGDAQQKIDDAKQELDDLEDPTLYVLDRSTNTAWVTFDSDSSIVDRLSAIFPVFFFLIAALVCSTTMTRMVDDDRTQIGTLRALGYSRGSILAKYLTYAGSAATLGCVMGYFFGGALFPLVIWKAYQMLYKIPGFQWVYESWLFWICLAAALLCSVGVTYLACRHEMRSTPADLILPKTPAAGKRIFLERITPIWKRLKFLRKVSLRNIFRFKKRMFMMILGIAGCTALVLTGFGIKDSVARIADYQFDDIQKYDISVTFDAVVDDALHQRLLDCCADQLETDAVTLMAAGEVSGSDATKEAYLVATDDAALTQLIDLHMDGVTIPYPGSGEIVISEKLADLVGVKVGEQLTVSLSDDEKAELRVVGLVENYVYNYIYMTGDTYEAAFGQAFAPKTVLLRVNEDVDVHTLGAAISNLKDVTTVTVVANTRSTIANMMRSLDYVVALVLASAAALAFVVLFNLGNINISERVREIATIKVLGFHAKETGAYVFRENLILTIMGIVCGLPLGIALHAFVISQIKVDLVSFKCVLLPRSYLLTVLLVLLFAYITDLILRRKIAKIDMAESLKSIE